MNGLKVRQKKMTRFEKWKKETKYEEPLKQTIICLKLCGHCNKCPMANELNICVENGLKTIEEVNEIEKWLNEECDENE